MKAEINEGMTFIHLHGSEDFNIQFTKRIELGDVIKEFKEFLIAAGYNEEGINSYIDLE